LTRLAWLSGALLSTVRSGLLPAILGLVTIVLAACSRPSQPGSSVPAPSDSSAEWSQLASLAKREGRLAIAISPGVAYRESAVEFEKQFPYISMDVTQSAARDIQSRLLSERQSGSYLLDVYRASKTILPLRDAGGFVPFRPQIIRPDVLDDSKWLDGFSAGFEETKQQIYCYEGITAFLFSVNRDVIPESQLSSVEQLVEPQWRGKIAAINLLAPSSASAGVAYLTLLKGQDWVRTLLSQNITVTNDDRQLAEWVVRGTYPIAFAPDAAQLLSLRNQGLGQNVKPLAPTSELGGRFTTGNGCMAIMNNAPHPAAARLFANWMLTQEAQAKWVAATGENSRRLDVPGPPDTAPRPGAYLKDVTYEPNGDLQGQAIALARTIIK
jgi:iron(III) transport system substrate-binding protein